MSRAQSIGVPCLSVSVSHRLWNASILIPQSQGQMRPFQWVLALSLGSALSSRTSIIISICSTYGFSKCMIKPVPMPRKDHVEARPPGRPRLPKLGSEDESSAQRPCGPEVPPLCHASRLVGDQRGYSDTQPLMGPSACLFL